MFARFSPSPEPVRLVAAMVYIAALGGFASEATGQQSAEPLGPAAQSVLEVAAGELERLSSFEGTNRDRLELLRRNLSRYFVVNLVPSNEEGVRRVLGTLERMSRRAAFEMYRAAVALARQQGGSQVSQRQMGTLLPRVLPVQPTAFDELVFFPDSPSSTTIELLDLEAFRSTGFTWQVLAHLAENQIESLPDALPMEPGAVGLLAEGINAYGLLVLRLGGVETREDFAPHLQSRHLRAAGKIIAERGGDRLEVSAQAVEKSPDSSWFREISESAGLRFRHVSSDWIARFRRYGHIAPTFSGGGVSAGHLDEDDWIDLVVCGGRGCAAFRNLGDGTFEDITARTGLSVAGEARMALLADFDNDGRTDVFVTYARDTNRLFHNQGGGRFRDITAGSGLEREGDISGPSVAFDFDNDGLLDIYVGNFGNYLGGEAPWSPNASTNGMPNRLYHNLGGLQFRDVTVAAGVGNTGWSQALSHLDYDRDGDQDLYIANDFGPNELLVNNGDGTFTAAGTTTASDDPFHGMNVSFADLNRDQHADIFVTNIWYWNATRDEVTETNSLLLSTVDEAGGVSYRRLEDPEFLGHDTGWSWGSVFLDADNDGDDDLYVVNGFTDYFTFTQYRPSPTYPDELYAINNGSEPNWFFRNDDGLPTVHVPDSGLELDGINSRGAASLDFDGDGDLDVVVSTFHSTTRLFRNDGAPPEHHWISLELVGDPHRGSSRDAIGAEVVVRGADDLYVWRQRSGGEGYLSVSSPQIEVGTGNRTSVQLEVTWPGGERQQLTEVPMDRRLRLTQGQEQVEILEER